MLRCAKERKDTSVVQKNGDKTYISTTRGLFTLGLALAILPIWRFIWWSAFTLGLAIGMQLAIGIGNRDAKQMNTKRNLHSEFLPYEKLVHFVTDLALIWQLIWQLVWQFRITFTGVAKCKKVQNLAKINLSTRIFDINQGFQEWWFSLLHLEFSTLDFMCNNQWLLHWWLTSFNSENFSCFEVIFGDFCFYFWVLFALTFFEITNFIWHFHFYLAIGMATAWKSQVFPCQLPIVKQTNTKPESEHK